MSLPAADVYLYTDGACLGNPGPGGWAAVLKWQEEVKELSGGQPDTTNNPNGIKCGYSGSCRPKAPSARAYRHRQQICNEWRQDWMPRWKQNNWRTAAKKPVANKELWLELDALCQTHQTSWEWVKGHSGHPMNERCDALASAARPPLSRKTAKT